MLVFTGMPMTYVKMKHESNKNLLNLNDTLTPNIIRTHNYIKYQ
jgi:hypothetical protein